MIAPGVYTLENILEIMPIPSRAEISAELNRILDTPDGDRINLEEFEHLRLQVLNALAIPGAYLNGD